MRTLLAALTVATALSTSAMAQIHIGVFVPVPALRVEVGPPPAPPGPPARFVLEPGHWQYDGARYVWVGRHWIPRVYGAHFVQGHWHRGIWVAARWR